MKSKVISSIFRMVFIFVSFHENVLSEDLEGNLGYIAGYSELDKYGMPTGLFVDVVKAIDDVYIQGNININIYPFARSLKNVQIGRADFHLPLVKSPHISLEELPFAYATECLARVTFVLYTRANASPLSKESMHQYIIGTLRGHAGFFPFDVIESNDVEQGIQKLIRGRTDGYIMAHTAVDLYILKHKIKNIRRVFFEKWDSCIVIRKGKKGNKINGIITKALRELKRNGRLNKIVEPINRPYVDWQPYDMPW